MRRQWGYWVQKWVGHQIALCSSVRCHLQTWASLADTLLERDLPRVPHGWNAGSVCIVHGGHQQCW